MCTFLPSKSDGCDIVFTCLNPSLGRMRELSLAPLLPAKTKGKDLLTIVIITSSSPPSSSEKTRLLFLLLLYFASSVSTSTSRVPSL